MESFLYSKCRSADSWSSGLGIGRNTNYVMGFVVLIRFQLHRSGCSYLPEYFSAKPLVPSQRITPLKFGRLLLLLPFPNALHGRGSEKILNWRLGVDNASPLCRVSPTLVACHISAGLVKKVSWFQHMRLSDELRPFTKKTVWAKHIP